MKLPEPRSHARAWKQRAVAEEGRSYRNMLRILRQFEGNRAYLTFGLAGLWLLAMPALTLGTFFAGYVAGILQQPAWIVAGALLAVALPFVSERLQRGRRWREAIAGRLWTFEFTAEPPDLNTLVRAQDQAEAEQALRGAKLSPAPAGTLIQPPPDALDLNLRLIISRSPCWHRPPRPDLHEQIRGVLRDAGIRARVAGVDIGETSPSGMAASVQPS